MLQEKPSFLHQYRSFCLLPFLLSLLLHRIARNTCCWFYPLLEQIVNELDHSLLSNTLFLHWSFISQSKVVRSAPTIALSAAIFSGGCNDISEMDRRYFCWWDIVAQPVDIHFSYNLPVDCWSNDPILIFVSFWVCILHFNISLFISAASHFGLEIPSWHHTLLWTNKTEENALRKTFIAPSKSLLFVYFFFVLLYWGIVQIRIYIVESVLNLNKS